MTAEKATQKLTNAEARRFLLYKHGLIGPYRFSGKAGVLDFVRQAGCLQFDPIDVCGKNAELVLQSRVKGFRKQTLYNLLYRDRSLVDYFDKNLAIFPAEDWKYFRRYHERHRDHERSRAEIDAVRGQVKDIIRARGPVCSADLDMDRKVDWYWSHTKLSRAALEHLYFCGELAVHHKKGTIKYYDLIENCLSPAVLSEPDPYPDGHEHRKWHVLRRIGAVGLLWNRASDAWLNIAGLKSEERERIFAELYAEGRIMQAEVEGINDPLYYRAEDRALLERVRRGPALKKRCEFLAPLDNMLWDRRLILALFGFDYKWEIYTPQDQRKYGYYVLPVLYGDSLVGRIEMVRDKKEDQLVVKNFWPEDGVRVTKALTRALERSIARFARFNDCRNILSLAALPSLPVSRQRQTTS